MEIKLIFQDWTREGSSIYEKEEGVKLSLGDFHSGTTFDAEVHLDIEQERELRLALATSAVPVFSVAAAGDGIAPNAPDPDQNPEDSPFESYNPDAFSWIDE
ncbi:MAG: hypothetical protein KAV00_13325 [Phycisphaerae bacterium]|nr:hypothetical protein [Phycisphaerae bacterium]